MKTFSYTLSTIQQTSTPTISTLTQNLTGTNNVIFNFGEIDQSTSTIDKIIVTFYDDRELVFTRDLDTTINQYILSSTEFTEIIHSELIDGCEKNIEILLHREDGITDLYILSFKMYRSKVNDYNNINLIKTDFFEVDNNGPNGDTLLLTFEGDNPGIVGQNYINFNNEEYNYFGNTNNTNTSGCTSVIDFVDFDEIALIQAAQSHTQISVSATGCIESNIKVKYRTRQGNVDIDLPNIGITAPASPNTQFVHVTGYLSWSPNDINELGEVTRVKDIEIPIIDIFGSYVTDPNRVFLNNAYTGVGTSVMPVSGGYLFVDLYDLDASSTVSIGTSTLTAYINYN